MPPVLRPIIAAAEKRDPGEKTGLAQNKAQFSATLVQRADPRSAASVPNHVTCGASE
jgi:hypothetical protein